MLFHQFKFFFGDNIFMWVAFSIFYFFDERGLFNAPSALAIDT